jgi:hypothetical protein
MKYNITNTYIVFFMMIKKTNWTNVFQLLPSLLAGMLLIVVMVIQMNSPSATIPHLGISTVYVEYLLSFIASFVLFWLMLQPFVSLLIRGDWSNIVPSGYLFLLGYAVVAIILSPFGLLSVRFFIQDETYVKYISMTTIVSTLVVLYFTFRAALG